jgi:hypothetical protein
MDTKANVLRQRLLAALACGLTVFPLAPAVAQYDVGPGVCVALCGDGGDSSSATPLRTYVDPAIEQARREAAEALRRERKRRREVRRRSKLPYKGVNKRRKSLRARLRQSLWKLDRNSASVDSLTYERIPGIGGEIFVPGGDLGNVVLARPVNPTFSETKIASEQLAKAAAVVHFATSNGGAAEDRAFLAQQAAQIIVGGRSYVHVTVAGGQPPPVESGNGGETTRDVGSLLDGMMRAQAAIRRSETERAGIVNEARDGIKKLAVLQRDIEKANPGKKQTRLREQARELAGKLERLETEYMDHLEAEQQREAAITGAARKLQREIRWKE